MKYTPGPWKIQEESDFTIIDANGRDIAYTETCVGYEKDVANAQLIAAAPDLLEVCHNAVGAYEALKSVGADLILLGYDRCLKRLNQAIKKAEGK